MSRLSNIAVFFVLIAGFGGMTWWQRAKDQQFIESLPEGTGKNALTVRCTSCHNLEPVFESSNSTHEQWENTILWMQKMQGMPPLEPQEKSDIIEYLMTHKPKKNS